MRDSKWFLAGSISLITFLVYLPTLRNGFVWDDMPYIVENLHIRSFNATMLKWAFTHFYQSNWHPLTWISHALDHAIWGLDPLGHHLTNIILHSVNTFTATCLAMKLIEASERAGIIDGLPLLLNKRELLIAGGVSGILFGLHPLHVESVAWIAERKDLLCALFFLLSISAYANYIRVREANQQASLSAFSHRPYLFSFGFFILALLSKPMAVSLPAVLLILDWYPFRRIQSIETLRSALADKLPFIGLSLISSVLTILAQKAGGALVSMDFIPLLPRLLTAAESLVAYLWRMMTPLNLIPYYPYRPNASLVSIEYVGSIVLVLGITIACAITAKRQRLWLSVWSYYVITLMPTLGLVQVGNQSSADRYTYLPSLGPFLVAGIMMAWVWKKTEGATKRKALPLMAVSFAVFLFVLASMSYLTSKQIGIWNNDIVLFSYLIEKEPERLPFAYYNRGTIYHATGQSKKAIEDFDKAISLRPSYHEAYYNRGTAFAMTGQFNKAIQDFNKAISLNPSYPQAYYNRGLAFYNIGESKKAIEDFDKAISLRPSYHEAHRNRGVVLDKMGRINKPNNGS